MRYMRYMLLLIFMIGLTACTINRRPTPQDVVSSFEASGLEVGNYRPLVEDDVRYLAYPPEDGIRFFLPSLGENQFGQIMYFEDETHLNAAKDFYIEFYGDANGLLIHHNILVQMYVQLDDVTLMKYESALKAAKGK